MPARTLALLATPLALLLFGAAARAQPANLTLAGKAGQKAPVSRPATVTTIIGNGPPSNRVDVTFIGDGYTRSEIETTYADHTWNVIEDMITPGEALYDTEPYITYANFLNFHRINLISRESGIDFPQQNIYVDTALDGTEGCIDWTIGLCQLNWAKTDLAINSALAAADIGREWIWVSFNTDQVVGGGHTLQGGPIAIFSGDGGRGPGLAGEHAFHEGGHAFHALHDEYFGFPFQTYTGPEPWQVNVTTNNNPSTIKWKRWLGYDDPNDDLSPIGIYQGGMYHKWGVYRPTQNSRMWSHASYDAIAREKIILDIYGLVDPLDSWSDNGGLKFNPGTLFVSSVDPQIIQIDWYIDGILIVADGGESFTPRDHRTGGFLVTARAHDPTDWVRVVDRSALQQEITWNVFVL